MDFKTAAEMRYNITPAPSFQEPMVYSKEIESLKASHYAESVDAGMRERRLRRTMWMARAERAKAMAKIYSQEANLILLREHYPNGCGFFYKMKNKWRKVEQLCRAKAEECKEAIDQINKMEAR